MSLNRMVRVAWVYLRRGVVNIRELMAMATFGMVFYVAFKEQLEQLELSGWWVLFGGMLFIALLGLMGALDYSRGSLPTELEFSARNSKGFQIIMMAQVATILGHPEKAITWIQGFLDADPEVSQMSLNAMVAEIEEMSK